MVVIAVEGVEAASVMGEDAEEGEEEEAVVFPRFPLWEGGAGPMRAAVSSSLLLPPRPLPVIAERREGQRGEGGLTGSTATPPAPTAERRAAPRWIEVSATSHEEAGSRGTERGRGHRSAAVESSTEKRRGREWRKEGARPHC